MVAALRVVALLLAAFWAMLGFGVIDLSLLFFPNPVFAPVMPLEVSWGAFVTFFLVVPLATTAVRPAAFWGAVGLGLIAAVIVTITAMLLLGAGGARRGRIPVVAVAFCAAMIGVSAAGDAATPAATETVLWAAWCVSWGTAFALSAQTFSAQTFSAQTFSAQTLNAQTLGARTARETTTAGPPEGGPAVVKRSD